MRGSQTTFCYFTRSLKIIGSIKAARVLVRLKADKTAVPEKPISSEVKIARGTSHAIDVAK